MNNLLILSGVGLYIGSCVFLKKIWWKISFDLPRDANLTGYAGLVVLALILGIVGAAAAVIAGGVL